MNKPIFEQKFISEHDKRYMANQLRKATIGLEKSALNLANVEEMVCGVNGHIQTQLCEMGLTVMEILAKTRTIARKIETDVEVNV